MAGSNTVRSPHYGALQDVVDSLYLGLGPKEKLRRLDIVVAAEAADLPDDLAEIVNLLPPGSYTRQRLCDQLNSAIGGHAWHRPIARGARPQRPAGCRRCRGARPTRGFSTRGGGRRNVSRGASAPSAAVGRLLLRSLAAPVDIL